MSIPVIAFSAGLFLIVVSVLGGGVQVKEITIPNLGIIPRVLTFLIGIGLMALCFIDPAILNRLQGSDESQAKQTPPLLRPTFSAEDPYQFVNNSDVGATFMFPNNKLSLDTTKREQHCLLFRNGEGQIRVKMTRTSLPESKDVRSEREVEKSQLEKFGFIITYVAPEKESNWKDWYVLSGIYNKMIYYVRRRYLKDSVGSIEFTYPMDVKAEYEAIVLRMTDDLIFNENILNAEGEKQDNLKVGSLVKNACPG